LFAVALAEGVLKSKSKRLLEGAGLAVVVGAVAAGVAVAVAAGAACPPDVDVGAGRFPGTAGAPVVVLVGFETDSPPKSPDKRSTSGALVFIGGAADLLPAMLDKSGCDRLVGPDGGAVIVAVGDRTP
jgi:hypothetical protein